MKKRELLFLAVILVILINFVIILKSSSLDFPTGHVSAGGIISIIIQANPFTIYLHSPKNQTYSFSIGDNYTLDLNVSSDYEYDSWYYKLEDLKHDLLIKDYTLFTPNTSFEAGRWSNRLSILASSPLINSTSSIIFYVFVPNSAPVIHNLDSEILACEGSILSHLFNLSDIDEDNLSLTIDPLSIFYVESQRINFTSYSGEVFSILLNKSHIGNHERIIYLDDEQYVDSENIVIDVIEINNYPNIFYPGVKTIWTRGENSTLNMQVLSEDLESGDQDLGNLKFNISFSGEHLFNISSNGSLYYNSSLNYLGVHNITVCVEDTGLSSIHENISYCGQDGGNLSSCTNFSLTITNENRAPEFLVSYPSTSFGSSLVLINSTSSYLFNVSVKDADGTIPDVYWYLDEELVNLESNLLSYYSYASVCGIAAIKTLEVIVSDGLINQSINWTLLISTPACSVPSTGGGSSGGGSSGSSGRYINCTSKFVCEDWETCRNDFSLLSQNETVKILQQCSIFGLSDYQCGFQRTLCRDVLFCNFNDIINLQACHYTVNPNCYDGIKNCHDGKCELLVDCGGACVSCSTCSDEIQNGDEEGIDCGGPCPLRCLEMPGGDRDSILDSLLIRLLLGLSFILVLGIIYKMFILSKIIKKKVNN